MSEQTKSSPSGHRQAVAFTTSALLSLTAFGAGLGFLGARLPGMVESGETRLSAAWAAGISGGLAVLLLVIIMARQVVAFVSVVTEHASRRPSSYPLPPLPKKRAPLVRPTRGAV